MHINWSDDFSVGVAEIDRQHRELFERINDLDSALRQGKAKEEILRLIDFLDGYAVSHFSTEEGYMTSYGYSGYLRHKTDHDWFKVEFAGIKEKLQRSAASRADIIGLCNHLLITWFSNHIRTVDMALGGFLKSKLSASLP